MDLSVHPAGTRPGDSGTGAINSEPRYSTLRPEKKPKEKAVQNGSNDVVTSKPVRQDLSSFEPIPMRAAIAGLPRIPLRLPSFGFECSTGQPTPERHPLYPPDQFLIQRPVLPHKKSFRRIRYLVKIL